MAVLTTETLSDAAEVLSFLQDVLAEASKQGTWVPRPTYDLGDEAVTFRFSQYDIDNWYLIEEAERGAAVANRVRKLQRLLGGRWVKNDPKDSSYDDMVYKLTSDTITIAGGRVTVALTMDRDLVCERVQVGTEQVVVPAVEAQPERVEERPIYERDCKPLSAVIDAALARVGELEEI